MTIFLDRCVPASLAESLVGHAVVHASGVAWGQVKDAELIWHATEAGFGVLITVDR